MFDSIKKLFRFRKKEPEIDAFEYEGLLYFNFITFNCQESLSEIDNMVFVRLQHNFKNNGIDLYMTSETILYFLDNILFSDDLDVFLGLVYTTAYENPDRKFLLSPLSDEDSEMILKVISIEMVEK